MSTHAETELPALHPLEAEVMEEVWRQDGETTVRRVMEVLNARGERDRAYTTFMTIMARLDQKGLLSRHREGKTDIYAPVLSRDEYLQQRAEHEIDALVDEFGDLALVHFARQMEKLDPKRRDQLRRLAKRA